MNHAVLISVILSIVLALALNLLPMLFPKTARRAEADHRRRPEKT
jgi:uncharacterized protein YjeT (DUF2065 family)